MATDLVDLLAATFRCDRTCLADTAGMAQVPGWDSLTHMQLVIALEGAYGIELTGDEIADLQSIGAIRAVLRARGVLPGGGGRP